MIPPNEAQLRMKFNLAEIATTATNVADYTNNNFNDVGLIS